LWMVSQRWIALETSTPVASVALGHGDEVLHTLQTKLGGKHSETLLTQIDFLLRLQPWSARDIEAILVGVGPGSFTGLRVGIATAQGLAWSLNCPLIGVNSLDLLASEAPICAAELIVSCQDARKGQLFVGFYRVEGQVLKRCSEPLLLTPASLIGLCAQIPRSMLLLGSGTKIVRQQIKDSEPLQQGIARADIAWCARVCFPHAGHVLEWSAPETWDALKGQQREVQPVYLRPSDAEMRFGSPEGSAPLEQKLLADGSIVEGGDMMDTQKAMFDGLIERLSV
ncbi:MAG: tRNA (adenosine(37)-N6)-threonylcarbamoyltransferase complex dimerization subunit type 1 TsaB, partial [Myxococcota bacterium]